VPSTNPPTTLGEVLPTSTLEELKALIAELKAEPTPKSPRRGPTEPPLTAPTPSRTDSPPPSVP